MNAVLVLLALCWPAANRFWGETDKNDHISKVGASAIIGAASAEMLFLMGFPLLQSLAGGFIACGAGFWIGRQTDGVRGTFFQKSLRGWKYGLIYVGLALILQSLWPLAPLLFFWQSGPIHWLARSAARRAHHSWDYVPVAELADGLIRILILLPALFLALHQ